MKKSINLFFVLAVLTGGSSQLYAENFSLNDLPVIERKVVTVSAANKTRSMSVPRSALIYRDSVPGVFVLENGEARFRMVRAGKFGATRVEVLSGLFGDEKIIIGDLDRVHDGSPVRIVQ